MNTSRAMKPCANAPPGSFQGHSARPWKRNFAAAIGAGRRKGSRQQVEPRTARCAPQNNSALRDGGQMVSIKVFSTRVNNSTPSRKTKIVSAMEIAQ